MNVYEYNVYIYIYSMFVCLYIYLYTCVSTQSKTMMFDSLPPYAGGGRRLKHQKIQRPCIKQWRILHKFLLRSPTNMGKDSFPGPRRRKSRRCSKSIKRFETRGVTSQYVYFWPRPAGSRRACCCRCHQAPERNIASRHFQLELKEANLKSGRETVPPHDSI